MEGREEMSDVISIKESSLTRCPPAASNSLVGPAFPINPNKEFDVQRVIMLSFSTNNHNAHDNILVLPYALSDSDID